ncbi:MAG: sugar:cation symporter [Rhodobacteraceae bacterium]|nr:sugar:cation symporter [Paracoccaceae bacterium]
MSKNVPNIRILTAVGLFGVMLGAVGLPIYLHAPKYFSDTYGVSLASLGAIMFALRVVDFVQDPLLGRLSTSGFLPHRLLSAGAGAIIIIGALGLFIVTAPINPTIWFALSLILLFTGYSLSVILLYTHAVNNFADNAQPIVARWREAGQLIGICLSAIAPTLFTEISHDPYTLFGGFLISVTVVAILLMHNIWSGETVSTSEKFTLGVPEARIRPYLILAFVNAIPVAITSTLFLFYVEYAIGSATASGPLLLLFFGAAACSVLGAGDIVAFAIICGITGVLTGADLTLLPMIFIKFLQRTDVPREEAFGYWSLSSKLALALAVGLVLPGLEVFGFDPASPTPLGIYHLSVAYALVPSALKVCAIYALWRITKRQSASVQGLSR